MPPPASKAGLVIVAALAATVTFFTTASAHDTRSTAPVVIAIEQFQFNAQTTTVAAGETLVWVNHDIVPHTATASDGSWDSGEILPGESWQMIVQEDITLDYFCAFHPVMVAALALTAERLELGDAGQ